MNNWKWWLVLLAGCFPVWAAMNAAGFENDWSYILAGGLWGLVWGFVWGFFGDKVI